MTNRQSILPRPRKWETFQAISCCGVYGKPICRRMTLFTWSVLWLQIGVCVKMRLARWVTYACNEWLVYCLQWVTYVLFAMSDLCTVCNEWLIYCLQCVTYVLFAMCDVCIVCNMTYVLFAMCDVYAVCIRFSTSIKSLCKLRQTKRTCSDYLPTSAAPSET